MVTSLPPATILDTQTRSFPSSIMGGNYQVSTWFPPGYPEPGRKYPVIYLLDADYLMATVSGIVSCLCWGQVIPNCMIVGVGHDVRTIDEWWLARAADFLPPKNPGVVEPDWMQPFMDRRAPDFLGFLKDELVPFVESTYPADPTDRCLAGYSLSGYFSIYSLFHQPDLFQRYFIGSAVWEHNLPDLLAYEEQLARQRKSLPVRAFFSVGSLEADQAPCFPRFIEALKRRNYEGFDLETWIIEGENHFTGMPFAFIRGLRALFSSHSSPSLPSRNSML